MKIAERTPTWRREDRVLLRVSRAAWRPGAGGAGTPLSAGVGGRRGCVHPALTASASSPAAPGRNSREIKCGQDIKAAGLGRLGRYPREARKGEPGYGA